MASVAHAQGAKRGLFGLKRNSVYGSDMTLNGDGDQAVARSSSKKNQIATENVGAGLGLRPTPERKIIVIGNAGAGKTAMLTVYMTGTFPVEYLPTIFETTNTAVKVDGKDIKLSLWDTAGALGWVQ